MTDGVADVQNHFSRLAGDWATRYSTTESFATRLTVVGRAIQEFVKPGDDVLDFGCGAGVFAAVASSAARRVVAVDINGEMLRASTADPTLLAGIVAPLGVVYRPHVVDRVNAGVDALGTSPRFDVVLAVSVLEYVPDLSGHIAALVATLRPGGRFLATYPDASSIVRRVERPVDLVATRAGRVLGIDRLAGREYSDLRPRPVSDFRAQLARAGMDNIRATAVPLARSGPRRRLAPNTLWLANAPQSSGLPAPPPEGV